MYNEKLIMSYEKYNNNVKKKEIFLIIILMKILKMKSQ